MKTRKATPFSCRLQFILNDADNKKIFAGEGRVEISSLTMALIPDHSPPFLFPLRDIWGITPQTLRLWLQLAGGVSIMMYDLGQDYVRFVIHLTRRWNQLLLEDLLPQEDPLCAGVDGQIEWEDEMGLALWERRAEIRLYHDHLVIMPDNREVQKIPLGCIERIEGGEQSIRVWLDSGELLYISRMGQQFTSVHDTLLKAWNGKMRRTRASLRRLAPQADRSSIARAASLMNGGKAVTREKLQEACPQLLQVLSKRIEDSTIGDSFSYLRSLSQQDQIAIGFRGGRKGRHREPDLLWFLIPIFGRKFSSRGNAMALNMTLESPVLDHPKGGVDLGNPIATCFFRIVSRDIFQKGAPVDYLGRVFDRFLRDLNSALMAVDFCVEPITLSERRLSEPPNRKFYYSLRVMPEVRLLRSNFIGHIDRKNFSSWRNDVNDLLRFNVESFEDAQQWPSQ